MRHELEASILYGQDKVYSILLYWCFNQNLNVGTNILLCLIKIHDVEFHICTFMEVYHVMFEKQKLQACLCLVELHLYTLLQKLWFKKEANKKKKFINVT